MKRLPVLALATANALAVFSARADPVEIPLDGFHRFFPAGEALGDPLPVAFDVDSDGAVAVNDADQRRYWDAQGELLATVTQAEVFYSAPQGRLVDFREAGMVEVRGAASGEVVARYPFEYSQNDLLSVCFTDEGQRCHAYFSSSELVTFDVLTGEVAWRGEGYIYFLASADSGTLGRHDRSSWLPWPRDLRYVANLVLLDAATGEPLGEGMDGLYLMLDRPTNEGYLLLAEGASHVALMSQATGEVRAIELETGRRISRERVAFSSDGSSAVAVTEADQELGSYEHALRYWDVDANETLIIELSNIGLNPNRIEALAIDDSGSRIYFSAEGSVLGRFDIGSGDFETIAFMNGDPVRKLSLLSGQRWLVVETTLGELRAYDMDTMEIAHTGWLQMAESGDPRGGWQARGSTLYFLGVERTVTRVELGQEIVEQHFPEQSGSIVAIEKTEVPGALQVFFANGDVQLLLTESGEFVGARRSAIAPGGRVLDYHASSRRALVAADGIRVYNTDDSSVIRELSDVAEAFDWRATRGALLGHGQMVALYDLDSAQIFDLATDERAMDLDAPFTSIGQNDEVLAVSQLRDHWQSGAQHCLRLFDTEQGIGIGDICGAAESQFALTDDTRYAVNLEVLAEEYHPLGWHFRVRLREYGLLSEGEWVVAVWERELTGLQSDSSVELVSYGGPEGPVFVTVANRWLVELRSGTAVEADQVVLGRLASVDEDGVLVGLDDFGRLQQSQLHRGQLVGMDWELDGSTLAVAINNEENVNTILQRSYQLLYWKDEARMSFPLEQTHWFLRALAFEPATFSGNSE